MGIRVIVAHLFAVLLTQQSVVGDWTFSLQIEAASCQQSNPCELSVGLCLRSLDTPTEDRQSCPIFFSFIDVSDVIDQQLTPDNSDSNHGDILTSEYQGGLQIYAGVSTTPTNPPFNVSNDTIDEIFVAADITPGGEEMGVIGAGVNGQATIVFSFTVECSPGYGGDDCLTVNTCSEEITCNLTLGYCNTAGECVCHEGTTQCTTGTTVEPSTTTTTSSSSTSPGAVRPTSTFGKFLGTVDASAITNSLPTAITLPTAVAKPTSVISSSAVTSTSGISNPPGKSPANTVSISPRDASNSITNSPGAVSVPRPVATPTSNSQGVFVKPSNTIRNSPGTVATPNTPGSRSTGSDPAPIIAGVVVAVVLLAIIILIVIIIVLCCKKNKRSKTHEEIVLRNPMDNSPAASIPSTQFPIYATVNKENKRKKKPPEIPPPYRGSVAETDLGQPSHQGMVYAELDFHTKKTGHSKPPQLPDPRLSSQEQPVTYSSINLPKPRTPSQPPRPGEDGYYSTVATTK